MSQTKLVELPQGEAQARRDAMRDAVASARIEGVSIPPEAIAIMEMHNEGRIDGEEMIRLLCDLHVGE